MTVVTVKLVFWNVTPCFGTGTDVSEVRGASSFKKEIQGRIKKKLCRDRGHESALQLREWAIDGRIMFKNIFVEVKCENEIEKESGSDGF
jgi:hypothetical protein